MAVGVLAAVLVAAPLVNRPEFSFVLSKDEVDVARERMRLTEALYRGEDNRGQPFSIRAGSAVQRTSTEPVVRMKDLSGRIVLSDGPAAIRAANGRYDMNRESVAFDGPVHFNSVAGYDLIVNDVAIFMNTRTLRSTGKVTGTTKLGSFSADRLSGDLERRTLTLTGNARLRIDQR